MTYTHVGGTIKKAFHGSEKVCMSPYFSRRVLLCPGEIRNSIFLPNEPVQRSPALDRPYYVGHNAPIEPELTVPWIE
jgi:hypothetical protein